MKHRLRLAPSQELEVPHGGAGGGTRTHKGFRPETCEVSAFTGFATPAPRWLRTPAIPKAKTRDPTRAAARGSIMRSTIRLSVSNTCRWDHSYAVVDCP